MPDARQVARVRERLFSAPLYPAKPTPWKGWLSAIAVTTGLVLSLIILYAALHRQRQKAPPKPVLKPIMTPLAAPVAVPLAVPLATPLKEVLAPHAAKAEKAAPKNAADSRSANRRPRRGTDAIPLPAPVVGSLPEDPLLTESRLIDLAIERLHQGHDPTGALQALDQYQQQFPFGMLHPESRLLRVHALLSLGQKGEALVLLDSLGPEGFKPRGVELRVIRGELRAAAGRCKEAYQDFTQVLDVAQGALLQRAQAGRLRCQPLPAPARPE